MKWMSRLSIVGFLVLVLLVGMAATVVAQDGAGGAAVPSQPAQISAAGAAQIALLQAEKESRTPAQQKMSSHLLLALRRWRDEPLMRALPALQTPAPDEDGRILVDITLSSPEGLPAVLQLLDKVQAKVTYESAAQRAVRALMPLDQTEALAALAEVRNVREADRAIINGSFAADPAAGPAVNVAAGAWSLAKVDVSEGDATHQTDLARQLYGVSGAGQKICVISDGVDSLAAAQASGDLPPVVDVLSGQAGSGDEGTAMLEIVHDLAPGAQLGFATGQGGTAQFADNIRSLHDNGCTIIVDDLLYFIESPFQDNDIAQAVIDVTVAGAMYFSCAINDGNLDSSRSGTWEGDFKANGSLPGLAGGTVHDFGDGGQSNVLTAAGNLVILHWTDPFGASANDYDLYVMDGTLSTVVASSTNDQTGDGTPFEYVYSSFSAGARVVVLRKDGAANRMISVLASRSTLQLATAGATRGHTAAPLAFGVAAVPAAEAFMGGGPTGPYPNPFTATNKVEWFSSDGPRRIFFDYGGNFLPGAPAGNYSANGGVVRQKPDIAAADGVSTSAPGFKPFFGTSAAAPHAAAVAGLLWEAFPLSSTLEIRGLLQATALDIMGPGVDRNSGHGLIMPVPALLQGGAQAKAILTDAIPALTEVAGNGDAYLDPGESWQISWPISNTGAATAVALSAVLSSTTPGVNLLSSASAYPDLEPGAAGANLSPFAFELGPETVCGASLAFTLALQYQDTVSRTTTLPLALATGRLSSTPLTFAYAGPAVPIPDKATPPVTATVALSVSGVPGRVGKVQFRIDGSACTTAAGATTVGVDHTCTSDLRFILQSPDGAQAMIMNRVGGSGNNFCNTRLDDNAARPIASLGSDDAPFTGEFKPSQPLAAFAARAANGVWQLQVIDGGSNDTGNIRAFSLQVTPVLCSATPELSGLAIGDGALAPTFDPATVDYTAQVAADRQSLTLTPETSWTGGSIFVDGARAASGSPVTVTFGAGAHPIIVIELRDGGGAAVKTYRIVVNRAPYLPAGAGAAVQGTPVTFDALAGAADADGDSVSLASVTMPTGTQGTASVLGGMVTYTPAVGFSGLAVLNLSAQDGMGGIAQAQAYIAVGTASAAPQATVYDATQIVTNTLQAAGAATVTLELPPGAYSGTLGAADLFYLVYTQVLTPAAPPPVGWQASGQSFALAGYRNAAALGAVQFARPITLTLYYDPDENIGGALPETLALWYWDAAAGQWSQDGLALVERDGANRRITYTVAHLSEFAFLGQGAATNWLYLPAVTR